jgi:hypothetical protein
MILVSILQIHTGNEELVPAIHYVKQSGDGP